MRWSSPLSPRGWEVGGRESALGAGGDGPLLHWGSPVPGWVLLPLHPGCCSASLSICPLAIWLGLFARWACSVCFPYWPCWGCTVLVVTPGPLPCAGWRNINRHTCQHLIPNDMVLHTQALIHFIKPTHRPTLTQFIHLQLISHLNTWLLHVSLSYAHLPPNYLICLSLECAC